MSHLFWAAPPMARYALSPPLITLFPRINRQLTNSRTIAATVFTFSLIVWTNVIPADYVLFHVDDMIKLPPEIWRVFTSFLLTGPGIGLLFDTFFCEFLHFEM